MVALEARPQVRVPSMPTDDSSESGSIPITKIPLRTHAHRVNGHREPNGHPPTGSMGLQSETVPQKRRRLGKNDFDFAEDDPVVLAKSLAMTEQYRLSHPGIIYLGGPKTY